jgi:protein-S-isoprenylcysteine O-methyltransferase Ste14
MILLVQIFVIINCTSFLWAAFFFFERPSKKTGKFLAINLTGIVVIFNSLWQIYKVAFEEIYILFLATFVLMISFFIFWSTIRVCRNFNMKFAFFGQKSSLQAIVKNGTYNFIRHPFYTSYSLTWIAVLMVSRDWLSFILIVLICLQYYLAALEEEKSILVSNLAEDYNLYMSRTGRFFPLFKKTKK